MSQTVIMLILGKQISKWWWFALLPLLVLISPALLMLFFMGNNLAGAIIGPPAIWSRPHHHVIGNDVTGEYIETSRRPINPASLPTARLTLNPDGSVRVNNLPFETFGLDQAVCDVSGQGRWTRPDDDNKINLDVISDGLYGSCKSMSLSYLEVTGHNQPYELYWTLSDPDSGTGVWLKRKNIKP